MIGRLSGILIEKTAPQLIIDVNGVGYEVQASMNTIYKLPEEGQKVTVLTQMIVREDAQLLYGFADQTERSLFRTLIKVNGVGPKLALTILSGIEPNVFVHCVSQQDTASLVKLPGVGKKTAERLVVEMRDRLADWQSDNNAGSDSQINTPENLVVRRNTSQEAASALIALGYKPQEASRMVAAVDTEDRSSEDIIRDALRRAVG